MTSVGSHSKVDLNSQVVAVDNQYLVKKDLHNEQCSHFSALFDSSHMDSDMVEQLVESISDSDGD